MQVCAFCVTEIDAGLQAMSKNDVRNPVVMLSASYIGICVPPPEIGHSSPCHVLLDVHVCEMH